MEDRVEEDLSLFAPECEKPMVNLFFHLGRAGLTSPDTSKGALGTMGPVLDPNMGGVGSSEVWGMESLEGW